MRATSQPFNKTTHLKFPPTIEQSIWSPCFDQILCPRCSLLVTCLLDCLLWKRNLRKNYLPMKLFEEDAWVLIFIQIKKILFQKICIPDICIMITSLMEFGEQLFNSDFVSNHITSLMSFGEHLLTSDFVSNQTRLYLYLFQKEQQNIYITNAFWGQNNFRFFVLLQIKLVNMFWKSINHYFSKNFCMQCFGTYMIFPVDSSKKWCH